MVVVDVVDVLVEDVVVLVVLVEEVLVELVVEEVVVVVGHLQEGFVVGPKSVMFVL